MGTRKLNAIRTRIQPRWIAQHEIDQDRVDALVEHLRRGGSVPPVVAAMYGERAMPLDGHHRMAAFEAIGGDVDAWTVSGKDFEELDAHCRDSGNDRAEDLVFCGGVQAMKVAEAWEESRASTPKP